MLESERACDGETAEDRKDEPLLTVNQEQTQRTTNSADDSTLIPMTIISDTSDNTVKPVLRLYENFVVKHGPSTSFAESREYGMYVFKY